MSVPSRLGASARLDDGELVIDMLPQPQTLHHGVIRASVLSFAIDAVSGIVVDQDPHRWSFTTDMSVRMRAVPAPACITAHNTILRDGNRSVTCKVDLVGDDGSPVATGAIGFARVPCKPTDPPKPILTVQDAPIVFRDLGTLTLPLREEAGVEVVDATAGTVQFDVTPGLLNPAGTLQGAMVALLAEAAAEEMIDARFGGPVVVTELDLRYLGKAQGGVVRTRSRLLGDGPAAPVQIELIDTSTDTVTTLVYARAVSVEAQAV